MMVCFETYFKASFKVQEIQASSKFWEKVCFSRRCQNFYRHVFRSEFMLKKVEEFFGILKKWCFREKMITVGSIFKETQRAELWNTFSKNGF